jgi:Asp-tRNA(Asn)/Glu-tRNA(Gln) amidotransferase A subunit family amidase
MRLQLGKGVDAGQRKTAEDVRKTWQAGLTSVFQRVQVIALPTLPIFPPPIEGMPDELHMTTATGPANLAGVPALSLPVPTGGRLPASLQLMGPHNSEELLLAAGTVVEAAVG